MNLVADIGNSYTKIAVFDQHKMLYNNRFEFVDGPVIDELLKQYAVAEAVISTVKTHRQEWETTLAARVTLKYFGPELAAGIQNNYLTPNTLGADRLAAVTGARHLYPAADNLVISGGTCITYDWVSANAKYFGGSISPGLKMRYKALHNYTAGLPLIDAEAEFLALYGDSTENAIRSGVQNGIKYELEGFIKSYKKDNLDLNILLTGGDSIFFDTLLKNSIFAPCIKIEPHLVLEGLNAAILNNND
jgi:type III pantothenate kinase